jgi:hypothetical protein
MESAYWYLGTTVSFSCKQNYKGDLVEIVFLDVREGDGRITLKWILGI